MTNKGATSFSMICRSRWGRWDALAGTEGRAKADGEETTRGGGGDGKLASPVPVAKELAWWLGVATVVAAASAGCPVTSFARSTGMMKLG